jgi:hypothetical protein
MKNSKKVCLLALFVAFCVVVFSCGSSGGGKSNDADTVRGEGVLGNFKVEPHDDTDDKGTSSMVMTVAEEIIDGVKYTTYKFKGTVTNKIQYGVVDASLTPDEETLARLKTAKAISLKMLTTDGRTYNLEVPLSTVTDWGFHRFRINTVANEVEEHYVEMRMFMQPSWAQTVTFNKNRITKLRIQSLNAAEGGTGPYEFKFWDFRIYQ